MSGVPQSERIYSKPELTDGVTAGAYDRTLPGRGLLYYSTGDWWPTELERRAREHERLARAEARLARALRREQRRWPRVARGAAS